MKAIAQVHKNQAIADKAMVEQHVAQQQAAGQAGFVAVPGTCPQSSALRQEQIAAGAAAVHLQQQMQQQQMQQAQQLQQQAMTAMAGGQTTINTQPLIQAQVPAPPPFIAVPGTCPNVSAYVH